MPEKVRPIGSLIAIFQATVTYEEAHAISTFWQDTYKRMRQGEETYRLTARQCSSMVAWSLAVGLQGKQAEDRLPRELHYVTPTRLYKKLHASLKHTAGPSMNEPAELTLWQLAPQGLTPWQRPALSEAIDLPEMPRLRLAIERIRHLPINLLR